MTISTVDVINSALREINVISEQDTADANQGAYALSRLNQMMSVWKEDSIDVGYFSLANTSGDCPIPEYAELAVILGLAIACASKFGATISQELASVASSSVSSLRRKLISEGLDNADMTFLPRGAGHFGNSYDIENDTF